jgi:hypothetical protein
MLRNIIFALFFLVSCASTQNTIFELTGNNPPINSGKEADVNISTGKKLEIKKNATIAVISGTSNDFDTNLARFMTIELKSKSALQVIDQKEISKIIPNYPYIIKDFGSLNSEYGNSPWLSEKSKSELNVIQKTLKADYLLFFWTNYIYYGGCLSNMNITALSRFIRYPESDVIGYSYFTISKMTVLKSEKEVIDSMLKKISSMVSDKLAEKLSVKNTGLIGK